MSMAGAFKTCPFCKEQIREEAIKCRFCGEWIQEPVQPPTIKTEIPVSDRGDLDQQSTDVLPEPIHDQNIDVGSGKTENDNPQTPTRSDAVPATKDLGGWLLLLILGLTLAPVSIIANANAARDAAHPWLNKASFLQRFGVDVYVYLHWGIGLVGLYCAYVLGFKQFNAVKLARRGMVIMGALFFVASLSLVLLVLVPMGSSVGQSTEALLEEPVRYLIWFAIWYPYLKRSRRVRDTYLPRPAPHFTEDEGYYLLKEATKLEIKGKTLEALAAYRQIAEKYSHTVVGKDAQKSMESLQKLQS